MVLLARPQKTLALLCFAVLALPMQAISQSTTELKVKSAFLYNFTKFVKWPASAFSSPSDSLTICTEGDGELQDALAETIRDKKIDEHPLVLRHVKATSDFRGCQLLFVPAQDLTRLAPTLLTGSYPGMLTVSEVSDPKDRYIHAAMITFVPDSNRIRFSISSKTAEKSGMEISSKLLSLAISVEK